MLLKKEQVRPDLVFADHGYAGAAIRMDIPTITVVDTNDIDLLVASYLYQDRVFAIPMHDNAGLSESFSLADCFEIVLDYQSQKELK